MAKTDPRLDVNAWGGGDAQAIFIGNDVLPLFNQKRDGVISSLRLGDVAWLYREEGDWALIAGQHDGYLGWVRGLKKGYGTGADPLRVAALAAHVYGEANMKTPPLQRLSIGSYLERIGEEDGFVKTNFGYIFSKLFEPVGDAVDYAALFLETPYLWGGGSDRGIDCSGLIQLCYSMVGVDVPRDTDQQEAALAAVDEDALRRGDMVYWKGHVGILEAPDQMIHATAFAMKTIREPLGQAIARIGSPTSFRRVI